MRGRVHSREFKLECVRQVTGGQKRPAHVCREHRLDEAVLLRWRKEVQARGEATAFTPRDVSRLPGVQRLQKRFAQRERHGGALSFQKSALKNRPRK